MYIKKVFCDTDYTTVRKIVVKKLKYYLLVKSDSFVCYIK